MYCQSLWLPLTAAIADCVQEREALEEGLRQVAQKKEMAEKMLWETEMTVAKRFEEVEKTVKRYDRERERERRDRLPK